MLGVREVFSDDLPADGLFRMLLRTPFLALGAQCAFHSSQDKRTVSVYASFLAQYAADRETTANVCHSRSSKGTATVLNG
jgi:hypothetical protein